MPFCRCFARRVKRSIDIPKSRLRAPKQRLEDLGGRNFRDGQWMRLLALRQTGAPAPHHGPVFVVWCVGLSLRSLIEASKDAAGRRRPRSESLLEVALRRGRKRRIGRNKRHRHTITRIEGGSIRLSGRHSSQDPHIFGTGRRDKVRVLEIPLMLRNVSGRARRRHLSLLPICLRIETIPGGVDQLIMKMMITTLRVLLAHSHVAHRANHLPRDNPIADADVLPVRVQ